MSDLKLFNTDEKPTWCPGCGDFGILTAIKSGLAQSDLAPHELHVVSGIGCGSKLPHYMHANGYNGIHGRALPIAQGIKLANHRLKVVVVTGDGDGYGIGGNHFMHAVRRNLDITHIVEDNQVYGLTKGQYSPTSPLGFVTATSPEGSIEAPENPLMIAFAAGATFLARGFAGDPKGLALLVKAAVEHHGYALIDVLQPCVIYNKTNTYDWYRQRVYKAADEGHDPASREAAYTRLQEFGDRIPTGILYQETGRPTYEDLVPQLRDTPLVDHDLRQYGPADYERMKLALV